MSTDRLSAARLAASALGARQAGEAAAPAPRVNLTVNIKGGAPPEDLAERVPGLSVPELAKLERTVMTRLAANPAEAARYLQDPIGVLRTVAPRAAKVIAALEAARTAAGSTLPGAADAELESLEVKAEKPRAARAARSTRKRTEKKK